MSISQRLLSLSASLLLILAPAADASGQSVYPARDGETVRASATIDMGKGSLSGICIMRRDGDEIAGSIVNEFGIAILSFRYTISKDKLRLEHVAPMLDKWYIRRTLRRDLRRWLAALAEGRTAYENKRRHIVYTLSPLPTPSIADAPE